jgi:hypothetical protein
MITNSFHVATTLSDSWKEMEAKASSIRNTHIDAVSSNYTGGNIILTVQNKGATDLEDFPAWDVIAAYQDGGVEYLDYTSGYSPGSNEWAVEGIYMPNGSPEVFDPEILNPGEEIKTELNLSQEVSENETVRITISAPNGVTAQCLVTRLPP